MSRSTTRLTMWDWLLLYGLALRSGERLILERTTPGFAVRKTVFSLVALPHSDAVLRQPQKTCFSLSQHTACLIGLGDTILVMPAPSIPTNCHPSLSTVLDSLTLHKKRHLLRHCFPVSIHTLPSSTSTLLTTTTAVETPSLLSVLPARATSYFQLLAYKNRGIPLLLSCGMLKGLASGQS